MVIPIQKRAGVNKDAPLLLHQPFFSFFLARVCAAANRMDARARELYTKCIRAPYIDSLGCSNDRNTQCSIKKRFSYCPLPPTGSIIQQQGFLASTLI